MLPIQQRWSDSLQERGACSYSQHASGRAAVNGMSCCSSAPSALFCDTSKCALLVLCGYFQRS